jgi:hypothetical protein
MAKTVFITKPGDRVRLDPADEYNHPPEAVSNFNESAYYNIYDPSQGVGGWIRIGNRVNEGHAEVSVCLYLPDGKVGFMFRRAAISSNAEHHVGGARFEILEPFRRQRVTYAGEIAVLTNPNDMLDPSRAFKTNPILPCEIELDYRGLSPLYGGEHLNADGSPIELDPKTAMARAHFEQHVAATGRIRVGDQSWAIDGLGLRDHSWGPRYWQNIYWYRWLPISLAPDFGAMIMTMGMRDGSFDCGGMVFTEGRYDLIVDAQVTSEWDAHFHQTGMKAWCRTERGQEFEITGKVLSLIPLRNRRVTEDGTELATRITEAMTEYRCDGRVGYGLSEYLDQLEDGRPVGLDIPAAR